MLDAAARSLPLLCLSACGIVFGDIGTSPIYSFREAFVHLDPSEENVVGSASRAASRAAAASSSWSHLMLPGVLSMIFLAMTLLVSIKYLALLCYVQAPGGAGGTLAITRSLRNSPIRAVLPTVGIIAVALFLCVPQWLLLLLLCAEPSSGAIPL